MKSLFAGVAAFTSIVSIGAASAALDANGAIAYRNTVMRSIGAHYSALVMTQKNPDVLGGDALAHAQALSDLSKMPWKAFGPGTDKGTEKTTAAPAIWQDAAGFSAAGKAFEAATADLLTAVKSGDAGQIKLKMAAMGASCKSCHTGFRIKDPQ